ncbi:hypothetical protein [Cellvibrio sp. OA-2007]|uniref:hypothetical protein n=1 Tax=Cellvibrio sp. OA-2007 TaxID=529823 RepID=UPI0007839D24|nr:hypothetical protein [Cellvibrio sp. OA-2007]
MARFICGRLKKRPGVWRVDGIGNIRPSAILGSRVTYLFSEIKPGFINNPYQVHATTDNAYQMSGHAGWLRLFTPGTVWQDGQKTISPPTLELAITVDTRSCVYTLPEKVNPNFAPFATLLPTTHLDFGENLAHLNQTLFALVPIPKSNNIGVSWLIIPTAELFRYYVGASSRLLASALTGTTSKLVKDAKLVNGQLILTAENSTLTKFEACVYGRAAVSDEAREAFHGPHKHLVLNRFPNASAPQPLYINSRFPFNGVTTLHLAGKKIPLRNTRTSKDEWAIYVNQIRNCTHPLGFNSLIVNCTGAPTQGSGGGSTGGGRPPTPPKTDIEDPAEINDNPADPSLGRLIARNPTLLFDQINHVHFQRQYHGRDYINGRPYRSDTEATGHTFEDGKGGAGAGNQGVDDVDVPAKPIARDISLFLEMLKHLRVKSKKINWEIITLGHVNNEYMDGEIVTSFPVMDKKLSWYKIFLDEKDSEGRSRKVVWTQIKTPNKYIYLIEMELRPDERGRSSLAITSKDLSKGPVEFTKDNFGGLLKLTASHNGWPPSNKEWKPKHAEIAKHLFESFFFERLTHAYAVAKKITPKDSQASTKGGIAEQVNDQQVTVNPEEWAEDTLEKIVTLFG